MSKPESCGATIHYSRLYSSLDEALKARREVNEAIGTEADFTTENVFYPGMVIQKVRIVCAKRFLGENSSDNADGVCAVAALFAAGLVSDFEISDVCCKLNKKES